MKKLDHAQLNWSPTRDNDRPGKIDLSEWQAASAQLEASKPPEISKQGIPKPIYDTGGPGDRKV